MLHDITARDEVSHAFSHCMCRCTVAVFEVCIQVQADNMRDINVFLRRGGVWRILVPWKISQATLAQSDQKMMENGMHSFVFQMNCVHKNVLFMLI